MHILHQVLLLTSFVLLGFAPATWSQSPGGQPIVASSTSDSSAVAGFRDGSAAARERGVGGYFGTGFLGGLPIGFFGLVVVFDHDAVPAAFVLGGAGVIAGAAAHGNARSSRLSTEQELKIQDRDAAYQEAFREAYSTRLGARRKGAALWGGLVGTGVGFGTLFYLLSQSDF
jgi:hypothetical protein